MGGKDRGVHTYISFNYDNINCKKVLAPLSSMGLESTWALTSPTDSGLSTRVKEQIATAPSDIVPGK